MARATSFEKKAIVFLAKFFLIYALLQLAIVSLPLGPLENGIALLEAGALGLRSEGNAIFLGPQEFSIVPNCTGLAGISVLASIIFALNRPEFKKKAALLALGTAVLFPLNILRIYLVLLAAISFGPKLAEVLHIASWFAVSAAIIVLWYWLTKRLAGAKEFTSLL
jgi:exosortase/archaeosortase family protein